MITLMCIEKVEKVLPPLARLSQKKGCRVLNKLKRDLHVKREFLSRVRSCLLVCFFHFQKHLEDGRWDPKHSIGMAYLSDT